MKRGCACGCHWCGKLLHIVAWIAAVGYVAVAWGWATDVLGLDARTLFEHVVVLALLGFGTSMCSCCCGRSCCDTCQPNNKGM